MVAYGRKAVCRFLCKGAQLLDDMMKLFEKITEVGNHVGYLWIFFQPSGLNMTVTTPQKANMGPYGKTPLVPLFLAGTVCRKVGSITTCFITVA